MLLKRIIIVLFYVFPCVLFAQDEYSDTEIDDELLSILREYGELSKEYAGACHDAALYYAEKKNFNKAISKELITKEICEKRFGKGKTYKNAISFLGLFAQSNSDYDDAIKYYLEAYNISVKLGLTIDEDYHALLKNIADTYRQKKCFDKSRYYYEILINKAGEEKIIDEGFSNAITNLSDLYLLNGDNNKAIKLLNNSILVCNKENSISKKIYSRLLFYLAQSYHLMGDNSKALEYASISLSIREKELGKKTIAYLTQLNNVASYHLASNNINDAMCYYKEGLSLCDSILGSNEIKATFLNGLYLCYDECGDEINAHYYAKESLNYREKVYGKNTPEYALSLLNSICYLDLTRIQECDTLKYVNSVFEKTYGKYNRETLLSLFELAIQEVLVNNKKAAFINFQEYFKRYKQVIFDNLSGITKSERVNYNAYILNEIEKLLFVVSLFDWETNNLNNLAFDISLFHKRLILDYEMNIQQQMKRLKNNDDYNVKINRLDINRNKIKSYFNFRNEIDQSLVDSLMNEISIDEREISEIITKNYINYGNFNITTNYIKQSLKETDICIEFETFPKDSIIQYVAIILKGNYDSPKMIPLFTENQLDSILSQKKMNYEQLHMLVWGKMLNEIKGTTNVFFSPVGKLHTINIEILPNYIDYDSRNYIRLSSAKQILRQIGEDNTNHTAVIYGGIIYDGDKNKDNNRNILDKSMNNSNYQFLPASFLEAKDIYQEIKQSSLKTSWVHGVEATETSFKALDGKKNKYIHIGTHGFYFTENKKSKRNSSMYNSYLYNKSDIEDKAMLRSGLVFSRCNNLNNDATNSSFDDGILYAKEIENMDLQGLDLLSLSACNTGLGDISGEGVFGLQRAFKKAGANSILMSLWKVDDNATRLLITRFYHNFITLNMTKVKALKEAQDYVRNYEIEVEGVNGKTKEKIYNDPKYWASFILLDALN